MKIFAKTMSIVLMTLAALFTLEAAPKTLKVLAIGNSFTNSVVGNLLRIDRSDKDCNLVFKRATLGGCSLERHWNEHLKSEKDASYKPYRNGKNRNSLKELLKQEKWDIVTIQQVSTRSWQEKSYEPFAGNLVALIKKHAPTAEIVIQQTWSYGSTNRALKRWKMNQKQMFDKLSVCYAKMAKKYNCRVIPTGLAVQIYREKMGKKLIPLDMTGKYVQPKVPVTNDVVGYGRWGKDRKTGKIRLLRDTSHLGPDGCYMQACLWFSFFFGKDPAKIAYVPRNMKKAQAVLLQKCAAEALKKYVQVKKK